MGVSAYHIIKNNKTDFFKKSFHFALIFALIFSFIEVGQGHMHGAEVGAIKQETKLAAMESLWETQSEAPIYMIVIPDEKNEKNLVELIKIPGALSLLAYHDSKATVKGLKDFPPEERPPVLITYVSFRLMVGLGMLFMGLTSLCTLMLLLKKLYTSKWLLWLMVLSIPLPYIALQAGWVLAEVGRQPWIVYGLMKTADAVSPIASSQVLISLIAFVLIYTLLGIAGIYLMVRHALKGPEFMSAGEGGVKC